MFSLNKSVSIGVITRSSSNTDLPSSQVFKVKSEATILVEGSMSGSASIKLIKFKDPDYFRLDNSGTLNHYDIASEQTLSFNEDGEASAVLYNGVYCLVGGSVSSITVTAYTGSSVFKPHYALDLRSGFTYQNNTYVNGIIQAQLIYTPTKVVSNVVSDYRDVSYAIDINNDPHQSFMLYNKCSVGLPTPTTDLEGLEFTFFFNNKGIDQAHAEAWILGDIWDVHATTGAYSKVDGMWLPLGKAITMRIVDGKWFDITGLGNTFNLS